MIRSLNFQSKSSVTLEFFFARRAAYKNVIPKKFNLHSLEQQYSSSQDSQFCFASDNLNH